MTITALEIQEIRFAEAKKGYDPGEVDDFLERVATDVDTLNRALTEAASRIKAAEARVKEAEGKVSAAETKAQAAIQQAAKATAAEKAAIEKAAAEKEAAPAKKTESAKKEPSVSEQDISNAFIAAQKSAEAIKAEARKEADKVYQEAETRGRDIVSEALAEKQKALGELDRLRESCEQFRTEYLSLLKHFQSDAQKRLGDFDDIIPKKADDDKKPAAKPGAPAGKLGNITRDNDASVAAVVVSPEANKNAAPKPAQATMPAALDDGDDLDIEEID